MWVLPGVSLLASKTPCQSRAFLLSSGQQRGKWPTAGLAVADLIDAEVQVVLKGPVFSEGIFFKEASCDIRSLAGGLWNNKNVSLVLSPLVKK